MNNKTRHEISKLTSRFSKGIEYNQSKKLSYTEKNIAQKDMQIIESSNPKKSKLSLGKSSNPLLNPEVDFNNSRRESVSFKSVKKIHTEAASKSTFSSSGKLSEEDNVYLASVIGQPLTECLGEMITKAPLDPIEWIAHWLYNYANAKTYFEEKAKFFEELEKSRVALKDEERYRRRKLRHMRDELHEFKKTLAKMRPGQVMDGREFIEGHDVIGDAGRRGSDELSAGQEIGSYRSLWSEDSGASVRSNSSHDRHRASHVRLKKFHADGTPFTEKEEEEYMKEEEHIKKEMLAKKGYIINARGEILHTDGRPLSSKEVLDIEESIKKTHEEHKLAVVLAEKGYIKTATGEIVKKDGTALRPSELVVFNEVLKKTEEVTVMRTGKLSKHHSSKQFEMRQKQYEMKQSNRRVSATWGVDCRLALVCRHPILGDMQARPPMVFPETPQRWEEIGYMATTLYDHECYSRDVRNDKPDPNWENMEPLTYTEVTETGPWLASGFSPNAEAVFCDKRINKEKQIAMMKYKKGSLQRKGSL